MVWLVVHIYYLTGFKNRLLVVLQWAWSYLSFRRGARLIVNKEWRFSRLEKPLTSAHSEPATSSSSVTIRGCVTPVSRSFRPLRSMDSDSWIRPSRCRIVACQSATLTRSFDGGEAELVGRAVGR